MLSRTCLDPSDEDSVVRCMFRPIATVSGVVVIAQEWPCWLQVLIDLGVNVNKVYAPVIYEDVFRREARNILRWSPIREMEELDVVPAAWNQYTLLASGSFGFCREMVDKLRHHIGPYLYAIDMNFRLMRPRLVDHALGHYSSQLRELGMDTTRVVHAEFGGVTTARHVIAHRNIVGKDVFVPHRILNRTLSHVISSTVSGWEIDAPQPLSRTSPRRGPIKEGELFRGEGLLDVSLINPMVACKCVFTSSGWARRALTQEERLSAFDTPLSLKGNLKECEKARFALERSVSPLVIQSIVRAMWAGGKSEGVEVSGVESTSGSRRLAHGSQEESEGSGVISQEQRGLLSGGAASDEDGRLVDHGSLVIKSNCKTGLVPSPSSPAATAHVPAAGGGLQVSTINDNDIFVELKREHDHAKAVKSDDAEVPVHLWDAAVCRGSPTKAQESALAILREFCLRVYRRRLSREILTYMANKFGKMSHSWDRCVGKASPELWLKAHRNWRLRNVKGWLERAWQGESRAIRREVDAMREIVWRAAWNTWFEYPFGSRLLYFRFPSLYRMQALEGVRVWFNGPGPTEKRAQPSLGPEEQEVLRRKITKLVDKGYLGPSEEDNRRRKLSSGLRGHKSVIKYFAVPKGRLDGVVQDWRIVFDAGANNLNDAVFVPSFSLPNTNSLLRLVSSKTMMSDRDLSEMFHQFQLHESAIEYAAIDLRPLHLDPVKYPHRWMCWLRNLMGFRSSPYNSVRMYMIIEEVIRGDRRDLSNPFQWESVMLNLPGTVEYKPSLPWVMQLRADNSEASNMTSFVDDQRVTGEGSARVREAGHAISTRESYMGLQDALRKLRHPDGSKRPGAWAGVNVLIEEDGAVAVTVSQEKWDRLKAICDYWLAELKAGRVDLDFKKLQSDRGFLVYVTQAFPGMKPYLKGFHLSLESWREGRNSEGWKASPGEMKVDEDVESEAEEEYSDMEAVKWNLVVEADVGLGAGERNRGPSSGVTRAVPRFRSDLEALLALAEDQTPAIRRVRSGRCRMMVYGFVDASAAGFGATIERPGGLYGRFGLWGRDSEEDSSNYRELNNLVETVEEEASEDYLSGGELWIFTDNSTAESVVHKGGSKSPRLHDLVVRLRKAELKHDFTLFVVHVAGTRMIAQGTDGLSRGSFLEGVVSGSQMLSFVDLALPATIRSPGVIEFVKSWVEPVAGDLRILSPEEWFVEGHGIVGGRKDARGMWIPSHAKNGKAYLWSPAPVIADVALEECLKAVHKRTDAFHIFLIPRLFTPRWMRLLYKLSDFVFHVKPGSRFWPSDMHEPLFVGISLPLLNRYPWSLRGTPLLVGLERQLCQVQGQGRGDGRDILQQLLRTPGVLARVSDGVARKVLRMPSAGPVSDEESAR